MKRRKWSFVAVIVVAMVAAALAMPREDVWLKKLGINDPLKIRLGLDLQGGTQLVYKADLSKATAAKKAEAMQGLVKIISQRVNPSGTSEANVQTSGTDRILIDFNTLFRNRQRRARIFSIRDHFVSIFWGCATKYQHLNCLLFGVKPCHEGFNNHALLVRRNLLCGEITR